MDHEGIKQIIIEILEKMGVSCDRIEVVATPAHPLFMVHTKDSGLLIGPQGDTLRALNHILKKIVSARLGGEQDHFLLDVNNYHKRKIDELEKKSQHAAERVRLFGSEVELEPMNAYERMIIHAFFTDNADVMTESRGEGPYRHIIVKRRTTSDENKPELEVV